MEEKNLIKIKSEIEKIYDLDPFKTILSNPASKEKTEYKRIVILKKIIGKKDCFQIEKYTDKQVFHINIDPERYVEEIMKLIEDYRQVNIFCDGLEFELKIGKKGNYIINKRTSAIKIKPQGNNRTKNYILEEGSNIPVFVELGIFTADLKVVNSKYDKFKQINRFVELVDDELKTYGKDEINIIDFGCGKSYLTFVLYHYLVEIKKIKANIIGLDLKEDVIKKCSELARRFEYTGLKFEVGDINGYKTPFDVDMVVTLHACDTATDYALLNAINWNAKIIMSVPCCQHEINKQIRTENYKALTKYSILKERLSALMTDAVRGCMLEYSGYKTEIVEFIDMEHSPKNILIRARRANISESKRKASLLEAQAIANEYNFEQTLMKELIK